MALKDLISGQDTSISDPFLIPLCSFASIFMLRVFAGCLVVRFVFRKSGDLIGRAGPCLITGLSSLHVKQQSERRDENCPVDACFQNGC